MTECFFIKKPTVLSDDSRIIACIRWWCSLLPLVAGVMSLLVLSGCGCGKKKESRDDALKAPVSRLQDKEYVATLDQHQADQKVVARERNQLAQEMKTVASRVKENLKPDATEEDVKAALEKDEEWLKLKERQARLDQDVRDVLQEARDSVRERILRDQTGTAAAGK